MKSKSISICLCLAFLAAAPVPASARTPDLLTQMFTWWNQAFKTKDGFTEEAFRRYFTDDAAIVLNGKESVRGIAAMTKQFQTIQSKSTSVEIVLPFRETFAAGDKIFTYHFIRSEREGHHECLRVMGYAVIRHGKIALVDLLRLPVDMETSSPPGVCPPTM